MDDYEKWRELHSPDRVARDIDVAIEYLVKHFGSTRKLGAIGFCFGGGRMIETLARDTKNRFGTGAFLYGTRFESSLATQIRAPLLLIAGDGDDLCSPAIVRHLEQTVRGSRQRSILASVMPLPITPVVPRKMKLLKMLSLWLVSGSMTAFYPIQRIERLTSARAAMYTRPDEHHFALEQRTKGHDMRGQVVALDCDGMFTFCST